MARTKNKELKIDLRPAIKYLGLKRVIEQVGVDKIIEQVGVEQWLAHLSPAQRREAKRRLQ